VDGNEFITEVQSLVASFNQNVDQQLLPHFTHIDNMLKLQGQQVVANLVSLNQQSTVELIPSDSLPTQAGAAINTLTGGPIFSLKTPVSAYVTATQTFETNLGVLANSLSSTATPTLTLPEVSTTIQAEAEAYRASMDAGLQVTHTNLSTTVNSAVTTLESSVIAIANASPTPSNSTAESDIHAAIATFDSAILDTTGLFGLNGPVNQVNSELGYVPHNLTAKPTATTIDNVSGTASFGGTATLTATLNSATGTGLAGKVVSFTLDGAFAGTAVTDSSGVATLTGVTQNDTVSTPGTIVASFAGDSTNKLSQNTGNLVVSQSSTTTTLTSSANPSATGAPVTFTATVAAVSPGSGTPTGTVTFKDGATIIGSPATLTAGVATVSTSTLTASGSPHSITAVYSGDTNFTTSTSSVLSQVVNQATTTRLALTSGTTPSAFGQSLTFTATVAPTAGTGTPTGTVNFFDGTSTTPIGTETLSSGAATFSTSSLTVSGSPHSITAVYAGAGTFAGSTSSAVSQVVNRANTALIAVSNSPTVTGNATTTLTATLTNTSASVPAAAGQTVSFTITHSSSTVVTGTGTTNASGVATASVSTSGVSVGDTITASFAGNTSYNAATSATGPVV
jgi:Big-like domain-containing protein